MTEPCLRLDYNSNEIYFVLRCLLIPLDYPGGHNSIYLWLYSPCGLRPLFQFLNLYTVGRTAYTGLSARLKADTYTQDNTNTE
jgi:hypothetical protein